MDSGNTHYTIKGSLVCQELGISLFETLTGILREIGLLRDRYWVISEEREMGLDDISEFLQHSQSVCGGFGMCIWDQRKMFNNQLISWRSVDQSFTLGFLTSELKYCDLLVRRFAAIIQISNVIAYLQPYANSFHKDFFRPPNSNLLMAPGLSNFRNGYIEGVSAEMWFGEAFWAHARCSKADVLKQDWLHSEERPGHLYVRAWPEAFSSAEGKQGEIQRRLLDLLFGINGQTPPPLPAAAHGAVVQKVLVDGGGSHDLRVAGILPDGTRRPLGPSPGESPVYLPEGLPAHGEDVFGDLENLIKRAKNGDVTQEELIDRLLRSTVYFITQSKDSPNGLARLDQPRTGEPMLATFISERMARKCIEEQGGDYRHVWCCGLRQLVGAAQRGHGIVINPFTEETRLDLLPDQTSGIRERLV